jgi:predicted transcriptional regulator
MAGTSIKKRVLDSIKELPDEASYDDIMERIYILQKIQTGLDQAEKGNLVDHGEVKKKIEEW